SERGSCSRGRAHLAAHPWHGTRRLPYVITKPAIVLVKPLPRERDTMKTRITEMFEIEHPIIQGGMHYVGFAEMAAAVSSAGGLGIITGLTQGTPGNLAKETGPCRETANPTSRVTLNLLSAGR